MCILQAVHRCILEVFRLCLAFYVDADDMNKGPHAHTASILPTKQV